VKQDDLLAIWKVLESLTVSLDRLGSYESQHGREAGKIALRQYFDNDLFRDIASARKLLRGELVKQYPTIEPHLEMLAESPEIKYWHP
jgi:hypothetical protein